MKPKSPQNFSLAQKKFAENIALEIIQRKIITLTDLNQRRFFWASKLGLREMPDNAFLLSKAHSLEQYSKTDEKLLCSLLEIKPVRSSAGIQVVAVMLPPFKCPGKCIYCPSAFKDQKAPQSYTGFEPSAMRAQRLNFDIKKIVFARIKQLDATGHFADKIELIFQGSSFTALSPQKQSSIVMNALDGVTNSNSKNINEAITRAEFSQRRVVGITFETRPDLCSKNQIKKMLELGGTRVELGVQIPDNSVYKKINRGHSVEDVVESTQRLKDSAFKVLYHLMPGLPGSNYKNDFKNFKKIFSDSKFKPDMVKFYPCLVIKGTPLYNEWKKGKFEPTGDEQAVKLLSKLKENIPKWVRIMRVNRDIPSNLISAGVMKTNLRQLVEKEMHSNGTHCDCIRCREAGTSSTLEELSKAKLVVETYSASGGIEKFVSFESPKTLFGFARLRIPHKPFLKPITPHSALLRELHVYGRALNIGDLSNDSSIQHKGIGLMLMQEAERIAREEFDSKKMLVISGIGVREYYYKKLGYKKDFFFVSKEL